MRRERRHLEGCRGERALRFDTGSRQSEAWAAPCTRRLAAPIDESTLRRRCLDACGRGAGRVDFHRFERTELSISKRPIAVRSTAPPIMGGVFVYVLDLFRQRCSVDNGEASDSSIGSMAKAALTPKR